MRVFSLFGAPGCGKTTEMVRRLDRFTSSGVSPDRITFVSFTRAAALEAISRVGGVGYNISTIHSLCYRKLGLKRQVVVDDRKLIKFFDELGVPFFHQNSDEEYMTPESAVGNEYLSLLALARSREISPHDVYDKYGNTGTMGEFNMFLKAYNQWKDSYGFLDFGDMLEASISTGAKIDSDILIVDEAQDLSSVQWSALNSMLRGSEVKEVHIAGDDDQVLHAWAGADANGMQKFEELHGAGRVVLSKSYRLPRSVHAVATKLIDTIPNRVHKVFAPRNEEGVIERWGDQPPIDNRDTLILARTNTMVSRIEKELIEELVPYEKLGTNGRGAWKSQLALAVRVWQKWERGDDITEHDLSTVMRIANRSAQAKIESGDLAGVFNNSWKDSLRFTERSESFINDAYDKLSSEIRVRVGTIHSSKGMEADRVMLHTEITPKIIEEMEEDPYSETRVFYVGVTRTRHQLDIIGEINGFRIE